MEEWLEVLRKCLDHSSWKLFPKQSTNISILLLIGIKARKKVKRMSELPMNCPVLYKYSLSVQLCQRFHNGEESSLFIALKIFF